MCYISITNEEPIIKCFLDGSRQLKEEITVVYNDFCFTVPKDYKCDGSSIPRFFWRVVGSPTTGQNLLCGICHDYMYQFKVFPRDLCDEIFRDLLVHLGKWKWQAYLMYKAVRWFGGSHY